MGNVATKKKLIAIAALSVPATPFAANAQDAAPDYILNVPVRIENVPPLGGHRIQVLCSIKHREAAGSTAGTTDVRSPVLDIGPEGCRGTVQSRVALPPGITRARGWGCSHIFFTVTDAAGRRVSMNPYAENYTALTGQALRTRTTLVQDLFR